MVCSYLTAPYKSRNILAKAPRGPRLRKHAQLCTLRRKALADCMEALIGSFYLTGGEAGFPHLNGCEKVYIHLLRIPVM